VCSLQKKQDCFPLKLSIFFGEVTLENATYIVHVKKTTDGKYTPTVLSVCPWILFMVIEYDSLIGN
jgi:hypothetical protein